MLKSILAQLRTEAKDHPGQAMSRKLKNGLHISITFQADHFRLIISREKVSPGVAEWLTVLHHWPDPIDEAVEPVALRSGTRISIRGEIPVTSYRQMTFDGSEPRA